VSFFTFFEKLEIYQNFHYGPEIRIVLRKRLVRELGKTDFSEFFTQHLEPIDVSSVQISCNLVQRLTRYKQKQNGVVFPESPCTLRLLFC
jgi:hypothetical protein